MSSKRRLREQKCVREKLKKRLKCSILKEHRGGTLQKQRLIHDCFSLIMGFLEPRDWAALSLTHREWCVWIQESFWWYKYLLTYHHAPQNPNSPSHPLNQTMSPLDSRLLVGVLKSSECVFHDREEGFNYVSIGTTLCTACHNRYLTGRLLVSDACRFFGLSKKDLVPLPTTRERRWRGSWVWIYWYRKVDLAKLACRLYGGFRFIKNKSRKRKLKKLLKWINAKVDISDLSLPSVLEEASEDLNRRIRTFLQGEGKPVDERVGGYQKQALILARAFEAERVERRQKEVEDYGLGLRRSQKKRWQAVSSSLLFKKNLNQWLRSEESINCFKDACKKKSLALIRTYVERSTWEIPWDSLWGCYQTMIHIVKQAQRFEDLAINPQSFLKETLHKTQTIWSHTRQQKWEQLKKEYSKAALRAAIQLGVMARFYRGEICVDDVFQNTLSKVSTRILTNIRTNFMQPKGLRPSILRKKYARLQLQVDKQIASFDFSNESLMILINKLEKCWLFERAKLLTTIKQKQYGLWWLANTSDINKLFLREEMEFVEYQELIEEKIVWPAVKGFRDLPQDLTTLTYKKILSSFPSILDRMRAHYPLLRPLPTDQPPGAVLRVLEEPLSLIWIRIRLKRCTHNKCHQAFSLRCRVQLCGICCRNRLSGPQCSWHKSLLED